MGNTTRRRKKHRKQRIDACDWHAGNTWKTYTNGSTTSYEKVCIKQLQRRGRLGQFRGHLDKSTFFARSSLRELTPVGI